VRRQLRFYYLPQISSSTPLTRVARVDIAHLPLRAAELVRRGAAEPRAGAARRRRVLYATLSWLAAGCVNASAAHLRLRAARAIHASCSCLAALGVAGLGERWTLGTRAINADAVTARSPPGAAGAAIRDVAHPREFVWAHLPLRAAELARRGAAEPRAGAAPRRGVYATLSWLAAVQGTARVAAHLRGGAARAIHASRSCLAALGVAGRGARWTRGARAINAVAATARSPPGAAGVAIR